MEESCVINPQELRKQSRKYPLTTVVRYCTDPIFVIVFGLYLYFWLGTIFFVFMNGRSKEFLDWNIYEIRMNEVSKEILDYPIIPYVVKHAMEMVKNIHHIDPHITGFIGGITLAGIFLLIYLSLQRNHPKFSIGFVIIPALLTMIYETRNTIQGYMDIEIVILSPIYNLLQVYWPPTRIVLWVLQIVLYIFGLICLKKATFCAVAAVSQKAIMGFAANFHVIPFVALIMGLRVAVLFLSIVCFYSLSDNIFLSYFLLFQGIYFDTFITYFGKMIASPSLANWYWTQNKSNTERSSILKNISTTIRYHLGTASFAAMPILPLWVPLFTAYKHIRYTMTRLFHHHILDFILMIYLMWFTFDYSLIVSAIYGYDLFESTEKTFRLLTKKSSLTFAFVNIFYAISLVGRYLVYFIAATPVLMNFSEGNTFLYSMYAYLATMPVFFLLDLSGQVYLLCCSMDDNDNDDLQTCQITTIIEEEPTTEVVIVLGNDVDGGDRLYPQLPINL